MEELLTIKQTCEKLQLCQRVVYQMVRDRKLEAIKLNPRCWRIRSGAIERFLSEKTIGAGK